jgi:hypothetical protein
MARTITERGLKEFLSLTQGYVLGDGVLQSRILSRSPEAPRPPGCGVLVVVDEQCRMRRAPQTQRLRDALAQGLQINPMANR